MWRAKGPRAQQPPPSKDPATDAIIETSNASAGESSGRIPGMHEANKDLPAPGGPTIARLWPPAAAISNARFAVSCPLTIFKSGPPWRASTTPGSGPRNSNWPFRWFSKASKSGAATTSISRPMQLQTLAPPGKSTQARARKHAAQPEVRRVIPPRDHQGPIRQRRQIAPTPLHRPNPLRQAKPAQSADHNAILL